MNAPAFQMMQLLCDVVRSLPIGTNLALLYLLWALVSGQFLTSRGGVIPALDQLGLPKRAVRRSWQALRRGGWTIGQMLVNWEALVLRQGQWQRRYHGGYCAMPVDLVGFWRPCLKHCPTKHYDHQAGKQRPAIVLGLVGRVGEIGAQRLLLLLDVVRVDAEDPSEAGLIQRLLRRAKQLMQLKDVLVADGGFPLEDVLAAGIELYIVKQARNVTARRPEPPPYSGQGRPATRGEIVRPLARTYKGKIIPATPPDRSETWEEAGVTLRADFFDGLVLKDQDQDPNAPTFTIVVIHDPRFTRPLVLATSLGHLPACDIRDLYLDRWPVEQVPLVAKQMLGAHRAFVWAAETCQRLPELALLAGNILSFAAAMLPPIPTGFWDRMPRRTPGRLRRYLARVGFPTDFPLPPEIRKKRSVTDHLPTGFNRFLRAKQAQTAT